MFRLPAHPVPFVCWCVLWLMVALFARALLRAVDDWLRRRRLRRVELARCGGVLRHSTTPPRFDGPRRVADPSPSPRPRLGDYEARAIAEGELQT